MTDPFPQIVAEIRQIYREIDRETALFRQATGLHCPAGCGFCCEGTEMEATILELLPLAEELFQTGRQNTTAELIEQNENKGDRVCILYRTGSHIPGNGRCEYYPFRPLVCRIFGFGGRYNKRKELEMNTCKRLRNENPEKIRAAQAALKGGLRPPVFQSGFLRLASLRPDLGFQRFPINQALKKALEYFYWKISL